MLVTISRLVSKHDSVWLTLDSLTLDSASRKRLFCLPLLLLGVATCQPALAQHNDVSVLVSDSSLIAAASNAQVELASDLAVELPQASSSKPSFSPIPVSSRPFKAPLPPASMLLDSDSEARFRSSARGTLTAAVPDSQERSEPSEQSGVLIEAATSRPTISSDSGTFASRRPRGFALQTGNSFGRSPALSDERFGDTSSSSSASRNRFGDFRPSSAPKTENRFAPSSSLSKAAPPTPPNRNRFASAAVVPPIAMAPGAEPPARSAAEQNRFGAPTPPAASNRFAQPAASKAATTTPLEPNPSRLPFAQSTAAPPVAQPPQSTAQSLLLPNSNSQSSSRFPAAAGRFASPTANDSAAVRSMSSNTAATRPNPQASFGSPSVGSRTASNSTSASPPMIRRQANSSSQSFSDSSGSGQSGFGNSRLASQPREFGSQPKQKPLRGRPVDNDLRSTPSNSRAPANQNVTNANRSDGKVDRQSIDFAQQQLRNIQAASADETGTPVRLMEMFLEPLSVSQRKQMVAQYWETYYDVAALKIAIDYERWLNSISTSTEAEKGLLLAAQQMAADGQLASEIQLGKAQSRLLDFMPNPRPSGFAPLPADEPLVERYVTDYEKYKRVRSLPTSLRGIDPMLASTLKLITRRAATVATAKAAVDQAGQAVRNRQIPLASAIAAGRIWRDSQLDMVASTVSYNQAISDFVLTLEPNRSPEQLTAFMLGTPKAGSQSGAANPSSQSARSANQQLRGLPTNRPTQFR